MRFTEHGMGTFVKVSVFKNNYPYINATCIIKAPDGTKVMHYCSETEESMIPRVGDEIPMINEDGLWKIA